MANAYINGQRATPFPFDGEGGRFPKWMWYNQCMKDFFEWCKKCPAKSKPTMFGIDCYSLFESKRALLTFLQEHDPTFAGEVTNRLAFIDKYSTGHEYGRAMAFGDMSRVQGHLQKVLTQIQARLQWGSDKYKCSDMERLAAEQNCEVVTLNPHPYPSP